MGPRKPTQVSQGSRLPEVPSGRRGLVDLLAATRRHRLGSQGDCLAEVPDEGASQWVSGEAPPPACRRPSSLRPHRASPWDTLREQAHPRGLIQLQSPPRTTGPLSQTSWGQSSVRNRDTREADKASIPFRPSLALLGPGGDRNWPSGPARHAPTRGSSVGTATARSSCWHHPWCPHHPDQAPWSLFSSQTLGPPEQPPCSPQHLLDLGLTAPSGPVSTTTVALSRRMSTVRAHWACGHPVTNKDGLDHADRRPLSPQNQAMGRWTLSLGTSSQADLPSRVIL